ncbi:MAG TPA: ATP-binding cassette domain-containing protein [Candidatus Binatia bacterium]|nr:ATP-binding cassette domain-containing protein [Candidatus Binatia bacterium]
MIRLAGVSKVYSPRIPVLVDVNLSIERGEFAFLSGPTGAGKTTLLKLLFGAERATAGDVVVLGRDVGRLSARALAAHRRALGVVSQEIKLLPEMTALDNVALAAEVAGASARESHRRAACLLEEMELAAKRNAKPPALSGGERQKVAVARALVNDPALILADEPTENLDAEAAETTMRLIARARERGATVVVATHDAALAGRCGSRVVLLEHGHILEGEPTQREAAF